MNLIDNIILAWLREWASNGKLLYTDEKSTNNKNWKTKMKNEGRILLLSLQTVWLWKPYQEYKTTPPSIAIRVNEVHRNSPTTKMWEHIGVADLQFMKKEQRRKLFRFFCIKNNFSCYSHKDILDLKTKIVDTMICWYSNFVSVKRFVNMARRTDKSI